MGEDTKLVLTRTILHMYAFGQHLANSAANFAALQAPNLLPNS